MKIFHFTVQEFFFILAIDLTVNWINFVVIDTFDSHPSLNRSFCTCFALHETNKQFLACRIACYLFYHHYYFNIRKNVDLNVYIHFQRVLTYFQTRARSRGFLSCKFCAKCIIDYMLNQIAFIMNEILGIFFFCNYFRFYFIQF